MRFTQRALSRAADARPACRLVAAVALLVALLLARAVGSRSAALREPVAASPVVTSPDGVRLVTRAELAHHDGRAGSVIWLALCGQARSASRAALLLARRLMPALRLPQVYDVSRGARHYGPGGGYAAFAGRDGTRAFVTGDFTEEGATEDTSGLTDEDAAGLIYWRGFYATNYTFVGLLAGGAFYDAQGQPLPPVAALEAAAARRHALLQRIAGEARVAPSCNTVLYAEAGGAVWCDEDRLPRRATYPHYPARCLCVLPTLEAGVAAAEQGMELFADCAPHEQRCNTTEAAVLSGLQEGGGVDVEPAALHSAEGAA